MDALKLKAEDLRTYNFNYIATSAAVNSTFNLFVLQLAVNLRVRSLLMSEVCVKELVSEYGVVQKNWASLFAKACLYNSKGDQRNVMLLKTSENHFGAMLG